MKNDILFVRSEKDYGSEYNSHLLEQYKLYVESADKISDRRQNANNYFIAINTTLITLLGLSFKLKAVSGLAWLKALVAILGIIICIIFWFLLRSYKQLNSGKFKVIHEIEKKLPLAIYDYEWKILKEGKDKKIYYPFSHVELLIPWAFGFIYVIISIIIFSSEGLISQAIRFFKF